jgi:hypothetical protein
VIPRSEHPVLHQMLRRVIQDERRHFAFYPAQAKVRLADAPRRIAEIPGLEGLQLLEGVLDAALGRAGPREPAPVARERTAVAA